jgi:hypothetical protein
LLLLTLQVFWHVLQQCFQDVLYGRRYFAVSVATNVVSVPALPGLFPSR